MHVGAFGIGALASVLTRPAAVRATLGGPAAALGALVTAALVPAFFDEPYQWAVLALLAPLFFVVASGNTLFGMLRLPASRLLGEISYSIYLLHGLLLLAVLRGVVGVPAAAALSPAAYWGMIVALAPVFVGLTFVTFRPIERPAIRTTPHVQTWVARRIGRAEGRVTSVPPVPAQV